MQFSKITFGAVKQASGEVRIDAEYFKPEYLLLDKKLVSSKRCNTYVDYLTDGTHQTPTYTESGIPFLSSGNVMSCRILFDNTKYISTQEHNRLKHCQPKGGDILISKSGRVGHAAVVPDKYAKGSFNIYEGIALLRPKGINPYALAILFNSHLLQTQVRRVQKGVAQPHLHLEDIRNLRIPQMSSDFQDKLESAYLKIESLTTSEEGLYRAATDILLSELKLMKWKPMHQRSFTANFRDTQHVDRLDAEYFMPVFDDLLTRIRKACAYSKKISDFQVVNQRGVQPNYEIDGSLKVITSRNILDDGLDEDGFSSTDAANWTKQKQARVRSGDILTYTTGANIGRTAIYQLSDKALASNHVNILSIKEENPEFVAFVMNSIIGRLQTQRLSTGSAQAELYPSDIEDFLIPFVSVKKQAEIVKKLVQVRLLKDNARQILKRVTDAINIAVGSGEKKALASLAK